jgi:fumarate hydratase subunit beta
MAEYHLQTPLKIDDIKNLNLQDVVYISGIIYTARDEAHIHILNDLRNGKKIEVNLRDSVVFHCGPIVRKSNGKWEIIAAGPTTSTRMNSLEPEFIERTGVKAIIGKGGMSKDVVDAMKRLDCVYLAFTGGTAVLAANSLEVTGVYLENLGMPEAVWILEAKKFGPLIVGIDAKGNSIYEQVKIQVENNLANVKSRLKI